MITTISYIHLLALVFWIGEMAFFSFVGAPIIFKTLEREIAGNIVGKIFPIYFLIGLICAVVAILTLLVLENIKEIKNSQIKLAILSSMLLLTLISQFYILPKAKTIKTEIHSTKVIEVKEKLKKEFATIHLVSVTLNMITFVGGLTVLYFVALQLKYS